MSEYNGYTVEQNSNRLARTVELYFESGDLDEHLIYHIREDIKQYGVLFLADMFTQKIPFFKDAEESGLLDSSYFDIFWRILEKGINNKQKLIVDLVDQSCSKVVAFYTPTTVACAITSEFAPKINKAELCELIDKLVDRQIAVISEYDSEYNLSGGKYLSLFAKYVPNAPIEKLANAVIELGDSEYVYLFAKDVPNAPIEKLANAVADLGIYWFCGKYIYLFAKNVPNAPIEKLANAVINSGDSEHIYLFAKDVPNAPIEKLANAVIARGKAEYIYLFAKNVPNAPIEKLANAVINSGDTEHICLFAEDVPNAPIEKFIKAAVAHNCFEEFVTEFPTNRVEELFRPLILGGNNELISEAAMTIAFNVNPKETVNILKVLIIEFEKANISIDSFVEYCNKHYRVLNRLMLLKARLELKIGRLFGKQGKLNINPNSNLLGLGKTNIVLGQPQQPKSFDKESLRAELIDTFTYVIEGSTNLDSQMQEYYKREASSILKAFMDSASDLKEATNLLNRLNELKQKLDLLLANNNELKSEGRSI